MEHQVNNLYKRALHVARSMLHCCCRHGTPYCFVLHSSYKQAGCRVLCQAERQASYLQRGHVMQMNAIGHAFASIAVMYQAVQE